MISFKQYLLREDEAQKSDLIVDIMKRVFEDDEEDIDVIYEIENYDKTNMNHRTILLDKINEQLLEAEEEYDSWYNNTGVNEEYAVEIIDFTFELAVDIFIEDNGINELSYIGSSMDDRFLTKEFNHRMESYGVSTEFYSQGFLFTDGTSLDVSGDDHRIIDIDKWYSENIITMGSTNEKELTVRFNEYKTTGQQKSFIDKYIKNFEIDFVYYTVFKEQQIMEHGKLNIYAGESIYDIL